jgi:hypothetical protein
MYLYFSLVVGILHEVRDLCLRHVRRKQRKANPSGGEIGKDTSGCGGGVLQVLCVWEACAE